MIKCPYHDAFRLTADFIASLYKPGTMQYVKENSPALYRQMENVEEALNLHWDKDRALFMQAIQLWKKVNREMINLYEQSLEAC